jgi:hypothetical protein
VPRSHPPFSARDGRQTFWEFPLGHRLPTAQRFSAIAILRHETLRLSILPFFFEKRISPLGIFFMNILKCVFFY